MIVGTRTETSAVLLVEDHTLLRESLAYTIDREPGLSVVAQAESLADGREVLSGVDIAVVDLGLPDGDGAELIRELRRINRRCRVLILSACLDPEQLVRAVEAGAEAVIHKSAGLAEIIGAVRSLAEGETPCSPEAEELLRGAIQARSRYHDATLGSTSFTRRERQVLEGLAEGLENEEIARKLDMTLRTERAHMVHIFNKLGAHSRLEALVLAVRCGAIDVR